MAHWTATLRLENVWKRIMIRRTERRVIEFRRHLTSAKFHADTTIQVQDVQNWLDYVMAPLKKIDDLPSPDTNALLADKLARVKLFATMGR